MRPRRFTPEQEQEITKDLVAIGYEAARAKWDVAEGYLYKIANRNGWTGGHRTQYLRRRTLRHDAFSVITPESAYWAGFLMADGNVSLPDTSRFHRQPTVSLGLEIAERPVIEAFATFLGSSHAIGIGHRGASVRLEVRSQRLADDLARLGVIARKSDREKACDELASNRHFWRGYLDGDGCWSHSGPTANAAACGGGEILSQLISFASSQGIASGHEAISRHRGTHQVALYGRKAVSLAILIYESANVVSAKFSSACRMIRDYAHKYDIAVPAWARDETGRALARPESSYVLVSKGLRAPAHRRGGRR